MDPMLTPKEAARLLRVDPATIRKWIKSGQLPGYQFPAKAEGRQRQTYRVSRSSLSNILK